MNWPSTVLALLALGLAPLGAEAQQPAKIPLVGFLHPAAPEGGADWRLTAFKEGMRELGYVDGSTMHLEVRWGQGSLDRLPALVAELVQLKVDVIVAATSPSVRAAQQATRTIPIVMPVSSDPVADGLVASLSRPGGNLTGLSLMSSELGSKRLELLKELFPKVSHPVGVLWNPAYVGMRARYEQAQVSAPSVGMTVRSLEVRDVRELEQAFDSISREHTDALLLLVDPFTAAQRARIVAFAADRRLPAIYETSEFVDAGGLMSYGPSIVEQYRRAAAYVDKILKGAKPGVLPIEQPNKFELIVNLKAAKALGIRIPPSILARADRVVE